MAINIGIVGLPNVGKSTLFNALCATQSAQSANFPFCTIEPNIGVVPVPDKRLETLAAIYQSEKILPTTLEFVDIAGLVKGAAQGEGLGNQFLGNIRQVDAILQVVRCFEDEDVVHVDGSIDPCRDIEVIATELMLKDLDSCEKRLDKAQKFTKSVGKQGELAKQEVHILQKLMEPLQQGKELRSLLLDEESLALCKTLGLLTSKPALWVANVHEDVVTDPQQSPHYAKLSQLAKSRQTPLLAISAAIEAEISLLPEDDQLAYLQSLDLSEPGLHRVIRTAYDLLQLYTFFTAGPKETRAWTFMRGTKAPQAAGIIHSDFERGFIRAEIMDFLLLKQHQSEAQVKKEGGLRLEGKEYVMQDGDVVHFRFNV